MSEFTVMVLRFAFFALLWIFVFLVAGVLRQDLFGPRRSNRGDGASEHGLLSIPALPVGSGVLLTTYDGTREDPRSSATPLDVTVNADSGQHLLEQVWDQLHPDLRVAAVALRPGQSADTALLPHS